ncbi:MoaD/ThiS family protein [Stenotrophobium rhamnosiphilum]|uniref:MoaD/ThiS family protein n=1 Tax=Stenotrophobium rhamnosiphilum TaxID=2029166 RepID=A0A2T5ML56_9GAMM|nr:MoaD/ThiS family protein [Stenotrophobium rhamnosiphilum]
MNGVLCRLAGVQSLTVDLKDFATVADAMAAVEERIPNAADRLEVTAIAIGDSLVHRNTSLMGDEVLVLIPPVSGG